MTHKMLLLAAVSLLAAPMLAGCAQNGTNTGNDKTLEFKLGSMMPLTGALNSLGPDMENGAKLAVEQVNDANVGIKITATYKDDKTTDSAAITGTFNQLASAGVTGIVGPCCSGVTAAVLDLAKQEQIVVASPSATSPTLTEKDNGGYFLRISPSDAVQGKVLAKLIADDGVKTVGIIIVNNAYGNGLTAVMKQALTTSVPPVAVVPGHEAKYEENAAGDMSSQVTTVCAAPKPDAIVLVAYVDDGAAALKAMQTQGCLAGTKVYGSEGVYNEQLATKAGKGPDDKFLAAGVKGTNPETANLSRFNAVFNASYGHTPALYAAESYDGVMYLALAALAAKSVEGKDIAAKLPDILNAPGTKYTADRFKDAAEAVKKGDDIDFDGYAHAFAFDPAKREPTTGIYSYWQVQDDGTMKIIATGKSA
ncbi:MAG TPA: ABC transporter substrate-binding protein [Candidatus Thermoplasmatota archaeon]|nr:ABC transporter substrate-binding protein [Candidatus Thermoplasmatota archaeon]